MELLAIVPAVIFSFLIVVRLVTNVKAETPDIPIKIKVLQELVAFCSVYELYPRTLKNMKYLCDKCECSSSDLEKALFMLEEQNRIVRVNEGFREFYKVLTNTITTGELEVNVHDIIHPDTLTHLVLEKAQRTISKEFDTVPDEKWVNISSETGRDKLGPTRLNIYYEVDQKLVKIVKQGVTAKGDPYIFYKFSRR